MNRNIEHAKLATVISDIDSVMESAKQVGETLGNGIVVLLAAKTAANCRPRYVESLRIYLNLFARGREDMLISAITIDTVETWFNGRNEAPMTRRGSVGRLSSLFSFAERRGWIASNPIRRLEPIRIDRKAPKILTVEQAQRLMEFAMYREPRSLAFFTLALFAGIRPQELEGVTWANVGATTVTVDAAASKVRRRRIVQLSENAVEWIGFARETGALLPFQINFRSHTLKKAAKHLGFDGGWEQDILRHSAASYLLAVNPNVACVSRNLGNSPDILLNYYSELVTHESATSFWSIRP